MKPPNTTREALIVEALGDAARLIRQVEALAPVLDRSRQALADAHSGLAGQLTAFEAQVLALTERSKVVAVKHILAHTNQAARQAAETAADLQSRLLADAARGAFNGEIGNTLLRLQTALQRLTERPHSRWAPWLTHAAAAAVGSAFTGVLAVLLWPPPG
jgi:hypothetical protein